jgi:iron complex outermembrane receptor protein
LAERRKGFINNLGVSGALKRDEDDTVTTTGLYAQGEWKFAQFWSAHAGLRTTRVHFNSQDYFLGNGNDSGTRDYSATTPVGGIVFRATPLTSFYANLGRGFETPTFAELANRNNASGLNFALDSSSSNHGEVGVKSIIPGRARLTAALFKIVTKNEIVVDQNSGGRSTFKNVGHTDRSGLELSAETLTGGPFEARLAYTYLKAAYREAFNTVIITGGPQVAVPAGSLIPGVARNLLYAELHYRKDPFFAQLEGTRKSRVAVNDPNLEFTDGYTAINLAGGAVQQGGVWRVTEYGRIDNLTNRNYVGSVIVNEGNGRYYEASPRRSTLLGVQASLQF